MLRLRNATACLSSPLLTCGATTSHLECLQEVKMSDLKTINAIVFKEGDLWIIQGIELDIVARASDVADAPEAFMRAVVDSAVITEELGRSPLAGIKPAPERFRLMFERAKTALSPVQDVTFPRLPVNDVHLRLSSEALA